MASSPWRLAGERALRARSELEAIHHELQAAARRHDLERLEERNHAFRRQVNHMASAPRAAWVLGLVDRYVPRRFHASVDAWPAATEQDHTAIIDAITLGDSEAARDSDVGAHPPCRRAFGDGVRPATPRLIASCLARRRFGRERSAPNAREQ